MKNYIVSFSFLILLLATPALAQDFDCNFPPFGATLESLNSNGDFIKYMEKEGVSYYNYTNQCILPIHQKVAPAVAYGFVENRLYAKFVSYTVEPEFKRGIFREFLLEKYGKQIKDKVVKKVEGDWEIYKVVFSEKQILIKYKFNTVTHQIKANWYYQPLRDKRDKNQG